MSEEIKQKNVDFAAVLDDKNWNAIVVLWFQFFLKSANMFPSFLRVGL